MTKSYDELFDENGEYITDPKYTEILKLDLMLKEAEIPHTFEKFMDGWQVVYPENGENRVADAIEYMGSYGNEKDLLEIMGLLTPKELEEGDSVLGYITAENVFDRIKSHWVNHKNSD